MNDDVPTRVEGLLGAADKLPHPATQFIAHDCFASLGSGNQAIAVLPQVVRGVKYRQAATGRALSQGKNPLELAGSFQGQDLH